MSCQNREGIEFKVTKTGHIDTLYYLNKAHFERACVATAGVVYARDLFMRMLRGSLGLIRFSVRKGCINPARHTSVSTRD